MGDKITVKQISMDDLVKDVQNCTHCADVLPHGVRPVLQVSSRAKILIAGQAPGAKVHASGVPFDDASGQRLREWMGVDTRCFYDANKVAILPMGFCYPGKGKSGDLPPRKECAELWREKVMASMPNIELTLLVGQYALKWHLPEATKQSLTETVKNWREHLPKHLVLPHPSPRNNIWLHKNPWFELEVVPHLQKKVRTLVG